MKLGVLGFGDLWHLLFSSKWACCVLAVLGILSLHDVRRVAFRQFGHPFHSLRLGILHLGNFGHLSFPENGQVAFLLFGLLVHSLK